MAFFFFFFFEKIRLDISSELMASVGQLDTRPTGDQEVLVQTLLGLQQSFVNIDHEIFFFHIYFRWSYILAYINQ